MPYAATDAPRRNARGAAAPAGPARGARRARVAPAAPDPGAPLAASFYERPVVEVARALIGCVLQHAGVAGVIVETEAYHDSEPACHAHAGLTPRTRTLFGEPGRAYVYRSYGVHALFNAVCEPAGVGAAVLIRALQPLAGIERMRARRGAVADAELCSGPGKLARALAIELAHNDTDLAAGPLVIRPRSGTWRSPEIVAARRVGISKGVELPWRFCAAGSTHVSRPRPRPATAAAARPSSGGRPT
jgi:DNA-3-methyladenine glycosylase